MSGGSSRRYPSELRERAYESERAAMGQVAQLLGLGTAETVRKWVRQPEVDAGSRPGTRDQHCYVA